MEASRMLIKALGMPICYLRMILLIIALGIFTAEAVKQQTRARAANRKRNRQAALDEMENLPENQFRRMFRMSRYAFDNLLQILEDAINVDGEDEIISERQATNSSGSRVSMRTALAVTLRWLAGGSYIDICFTWGIAIGSFYADDGVVWGTMELIDQVFEIGLPLNDRNELDRIAAGYSVYSHGHLTRCITSIDGWVCHTRQPTLAETTMPAAYYNRKGFFGILIMAGCESNLRFNIFSSKCSGGTHDSLAWEVSDAKKAVVDDGLLPEEYYMIGDEAFVCSDQLLTPWSGHGLDLWRDSFNFHLSSMRQCIERAFAHLTQKWGIFWRPLRCSFKRWSLVCTVCAKLHNYCIDMKDEYPDVGRHEDDNEVGDVHNVVLNRFPLDGDEERRRPTGDRRRNLTAYFEREGVRRPRKH